MAEEKSKVEQPKTEVTETIKYFQKTKSLLVGSTFTIFLGFIIIYSYLNEYGLLHELPFIISDYKYLMLIAASAIIITGFLYFFLIYAPLTINLSEDIQNASKNIKIFYRTIIAIYCFSIVTSLLLNHYEIGLKNTFTTWTIIFVVSIISLCLLIYKDKNIVCKFNIKTLSGICTYLFILFFIFIFQFCFYIFWITLYPKNNVDSIWITSIFNIAYSIILSFVYLPSEKFIKINNKYKLRFEYALIFVLLIYFILTQKNNIFVNKIMRFFRQGDYYASIELVYDEKYDVLRDNFKNPCTRQDDLSSNNSVCRNNQTFHGVHVILSAPNKLYFKLLNDPNMYVIPQNDFINQCNYSPKKPGKDFQHAKNFKKHC
ncbi:hypothetical protein [Celerinatantimonas sp. MCCC 1A17872]|uniref:hypothetical protein n=1 Tax=Celerinatantimonas sp. MCCC 1A17872 TaxID=3177514 RepID=UPI0038C24445